MGWILWETLEWTSLHPVSDTCFFFFHTVSSQCTALQQSRETWLIWTFFSSQYECLLLCVIVFWTHYVDHRWHFPHYINKLQIVYNSFFPDQEPYTCWVNHCCSTLVLKCLIRDYVLWSTVKLMMKDMKLLLYI